MGISMKYIGFYFDGEYLHGKEWNGKLGKKFNYCDCPPTLLFEGGLSNGEKNGKGKKYYKNGNLKFEGEYLNGKKWNGKGYNNRGELEFELKNGNGKVKEFFDNGNLKFEGEYFNGKKWNGKGYNDKDSNVEYELINGNGKVKEYSGLFGELKFEGEYLNGEKSGYGKERNCNNIFVFEG